MTQPVGPWRRRASRAAATALLLTALLSTLALAGCGDGTKSASDPASTPASTPTVPPPGHCPPLPPSGLPGLRNGLSERDHGSFCSPGRTTVLVVLKAKDFTAATAWSRPRVDGPAGGVTWLSVPLTTLRGTTTAGVRLSEPGAYRFSSTTPDHRSWSVTVFVRG